MSSHSLTVCQSIYSWLSHSAHGIMQLLHMSRSCLLSYPLLDLQDNKLGLLLGTEAADTILATQPVSSLCFLCHCDL